MNGREPFLREIIESPDDVAARLIMADWLEERGDPRGEFIRVQCRLETLDTESEEARELTIREADLLRDHQLEWLGDVTQHCRQWTFRRGFVEYVEIGVEEFVTFGERLFAEHPVRSAAFRMSPKQLGKLAQCPHLGRLSGMSIGSHWIEPDELEQLLAAPHFPRLDKLVMMGNNLGDLETRMIAAAPRLDRLQVLDLSRNNIHNNGVEAIATSPILSSLSALLLSANTIRLLGARALADSPYLQNLQYIDLRNNPIPQRGIDVVRARFGRQACEV